MMNLKSINKLFLAMLMGIIALTTTLNLYGQIPTTIDESPTTRAIPERIASLVIPQEARRVALAWLNICPNFVSVDYTPAPGMLEIKDKERTRIIAYVLELQPKGYIIVTPDNELKPIIAYSEISVFDSTETPENILLILLRGDIAERLQALEEGAIAPSYQAEANAFWEGYLEMIDDRDMITPALPERDFWDVDHGPFLSSEWGQSNDGGSQPAFNYYTPTNYVCGCVATAFSQILNYYEWPVTGTGSHTYTWDNGTDPSQVLTANFGTTTYDWPNILDIYHDGGKTSTQRQAVGRLASHCGIAVDMNYASGGSGAYTSRVAFALRNYLRGAGEYLVNTGNFYDRLYNNMVDHRAGELSIRGSVGGHAVVIDGVQHDAEGTKYYHLNMGWSSSSDGWYDVENPPFTAGYVWDTVSGAVLDIVPTPDLSDPGATTANANYTISWNVPGNLNAVKYELQQAVPNTTLGNFTDDAESGTEDWLIDFNWEASIQANHGGTNSFRGYFSTGNYFNTMKFDKVVKIDATTNITYWWYTYYFKVDGESTNARFEISSDGYTWSTLRTYTDKDHAWTQETISSAELAAYAGNIAFLRFVVDHPGGSYYSGVTYNFIGFFVDDYAINNCYTDDWTTIDDNILTESKSITATQSGDHCYRVRANASQWWDWSDVEVITVDLTHSVVGKIYNQDGATSPAMDELQMSAYIDYSPPPTVGGVSETRYYNQETPDVAVKYGTQTSNGLPWFEVECANFTTGTWEAGDILHLDITNTANGQHRNEQVVLSTSDPQDIGDISLPVELSSFTATAGYGKVTLHWITESEIENLGFNIYRSTKDNVKFSMINYQLITGAGNSSSRHEYEYVDNGLTNGVKYWYKLEDVDYSGKTKLHGPVSATPIESAFPAEFRLYPNYPNPFNPFTTISYDLPDDGFVELSVYNMRGEKVATLMQGKQEAGSYKMNWDGTNQNGNMVASGIYFLRIVSGSYSRTNKMIFIR